mgnify:CR=1 FL=1
MVICLKPEEDDSFVSVMIRETVSVHFFRYIAMKLTLLLNTRHQWQGNSLDHLLSAMHAFPDAAFLGNFLALTIKFELFGTQYGTNLSKSQYIGIFLHFAEL